MLLCYSGCLTMLGKFHLHHSDTYPPPPPHSIPFSWTVPRHFQRLMNPSVVLHVRLCIWPFLYKSNVKTVGTTVCVCVCVVFHMLISCVYRFELPRKYPSSIVLYIFVCASHKINNELKAFVFRTKYHKYFETVKCVVQLFHLLK